MAKVLVLFISVFLILQPLQAAQRDRFVFAQLRYDGQWDPYPETWQDILEFLVTTTSIKPEAGRRVVTLEDEQLFSSPFLVIAGTGRFPALSSKERDILRRYCTNGGLVFAEDSSGTRSGAFDVSFRREIARVFPEVKLKKLTSEHPMYRSYYLLRRIGGRRLTNTFLEGIDIAGRTALVYSQNDIIGAWAKDRFGNYLRECLPGGQPQRFEAQKLTLNLIMYSVTGTYKSDAIHQQYILEKLQR